MSDTNGLNDEEIFEKMESKIDIGGIFKNRKSRLIIFLCLVIVILAVLQIKFDLFSAIAHYHAGMGNTAGNISNYGYAASQGDYIYYVEPSEDLKTTNLYRIRKGEKEGEKLYEGGATICSLNIIDDSIYFMDIHNTQKDDADGVDNKIYKMKLDGSNPVVINDNDFLCGYTNILFAVRNKIYYVGTDYNVYEMNLDGGNRKLVAETGAGFLAMDEKYIIYNKPDGESYKTYIRSIHGTDEREINGSMAYTPAIDAGMIYYANDEYKIVKQAVSGGEEETVYDGQAYYMNLYDGQIYFLSYKDAETQDTVCLFRVSVDGGEPEIIKEFSYGSDFINLVSGFVCYRDMDEEKTFINLMNLENGEETEVYSWNFSEALPSGDGDDAAEGSTTETEE